jgi:hypothetical protein
MAKVVIFVRRNKPNFDWISILLDFQTILEAKKRLDEVVTRWSKLQGSCWSQKNPE